MRAKFILASNDHRKDVIVRQNNSLVYSGCSKKPDQVLTACPTPLLAQALVNQKIDFLIRNGYQVISDCVHY